MEIDNKVNISNCELYLCGGKVRDHLLGRENKDDDYVVVTDLKYDELICQLENDGVKIFLATPEFFTIRCLINNKPIDLVYPRKEGGYSDGRHPDYVEQVKTLKEDSLRRDFTINAMYMDQNGNLIDYHNGVEDLKNKLIRTTNTPEITFSEDYLRILRAIRFSCQLGFNIAKYTENVMVERANGLRVISGERIREELNKSLTANPMKTMYWIDKLDIWDILEEKGLRFELTSKK